MPSIDAFRTKRGRARLTGDAVVFDESVAGYARALYRDYWRSDAWWRKAVFVAYALWPVVVVGWCGGLVLELARGGTDPVWAAGGALVVAAIVALAWGANYARGFRSPDRVSLDAVTGVAATRGETGLTRPRLVLTYEAGGGTRKRRVNLPSLLTPAGEDSYERAVAAFAERGFDVEA